MKVNGCLYVRQATYPGFAPPLAQCQLGLAPGAMDGWMDNGRMDLTTNMQPTNIPTCNLSFFCLTLTTFLSFYDKRLLAPPSNVASHRHSCPMKIQQELSLYVNG